MVGPAHPGDLRPPDEGPPMAERLVSRRAEENALLEFLDSVPHRPCALVVEGDPGIGKTTLWLDAVTRAWDRGFRLLTSRAAAAESVLAYAALADLLSDVDESMWADLPVPQRQGLDAALLRSHDGVGLAGVDQVDHVGDGVIREVVVDHQFPVGK